MSNVYAVDELKLFGFPHFLVENILKGFFGGVVRAILLRRTRYLWTMILRMVRNNVINVQHSDDTSYVFMIKRASRYILLYPTQTWIKQIFIILNKDRKKAPRRKNIFMGLLNIL